MRIRFTNELESSHEKTLVHALEEDPVQHAEQQTRHFFMEVGKQRNLYGREGSPWIFGDLPTALDAQMIVFVARLVDVKRTDLVTNECLECARKSWSLPEWQATMQGRATMPYI